MKRIILLVAVILAFGTFTNAQTLSKKDVQKISKEINDNITSLDKALQETDWKEVQTVVDKTATILEKNVASVTEILEDVNFAKLIMTVSKLQVAIEKNIDVKEMEKSMENIGNRIEKVVIEISRSAAAEDTK